MINYLSNKIEDSNIKLDVSLIEVNNICKLKFNFSVLEKYKNRQRGDQVKNYRYKFFILIATILLGFLIVTNIGINETTGFLNLNSIEYKDAIEERNKLYDEITALSDDNYELSKKIAIFEKSQNANDNNLSLNMIRDLKLLRTRK